MSTQRRGGTSAPPPGPHSSRRPAGRLGRAVRRQPRRNQVEDHDDGVRILAADGASALLQAPWPPRRPARDGAPTSWPAGLPRVATADGSALCSSAGAGTAWPWPAKACCWPPRPDRSTCSPAPQRAASPSSGTPGAAPTRRTRWWRPSRTRHGRCLPRRSIEYIVPGGDRALAETGPRRAGAAGPMPGCRAWPTSTSPIPARPC